MALLRPVRMIRTETCVVTIRGTATLSAYNGILNSAGGDVVIDGGTVKVQSSSDAFPDTEPVVSPTRGIMMPFGGDVEIKNGAEVQLEVGSHGIYSMDLNGGTMSVAVSDSTLNIQSGDAGISPASSSVSITDSASHCQWPENRCFCAGSCVELFRRLCDLCRRGC